MSIKATLRPQSRNVVEVIFPYIAVFKHSDCEDDSVGKLLVLGLGKSGSYKGVSIPHGHYADNWDAAQWEPAPKGSRLTLEQL